MSKPKKRKKSDEKRLAIVLLITAIIDLIGQLVDLITSLIDYVGGGGKPPFGIRIMLCKLIVNIEIMAGR